jgi:hypothetical protein
MNMATSYASDIRQLFRPSDVTAMKRHGHFDLSLYADVVQHAADILQRLRDGDMPCDAPWPAAQVDLFARWMADGRLP